jgi:hypothetical protein
VGAVVPVCSCPCVRRPHQPELPPLLLLSLIMASHGLGPSGGSRCGFLLHLGRRLRCVCGCGGWQGSGEGSGEGWWCQPPPSAPPSPRPAPPPRRYSQARHQVVGDGIGSRVLGVCLCVCGWGCPRGGPANSQDIPVVPNSASPVVGPAAVVKQPRPAVGACGWASRVDTLPHPHLLHAPTTLVVRPPL